MNTKVGKINPKKTNLLLCLQQNSLLSQRNLHGELIDTFISSHFLPPPRNKQGVEFSAKNVFIDQTGKVGMIIGSE